jgi:hypothetical protein
MGDQSDVRILLSSMFFDASGWGTGGHRRARQLLDLLQRSGAPVSVVGPDRTTALSGLRRADWKTVVAYARGVKRPPLARLRVAAGFARNYGDWRGTFARYPKARVLIWEDTMNPHTPRAAKDAGLRVVAVPQNLEALLPDSPDARTGQTLPWSFEYEIAQLKRADAVFTISREEQWLLRLRGVNAEFLPFFPPVGERSPWLEVRSRRQTPAQGPYLVLGSAANPPTRAGMRDVLRWWGSEAGPPAPVQVIGYGTESLKELQNDRIEVLGAVDDAALREHVSRARAVILHQFAAIGALIRVSEMLLAGVPVVASGIAARSTRQYQGLTVYDSFFELGRILSQGELPVPPVPDPPTSAEDAFLRLIAGWIDQ